MGSSKDDGQSGVNSLRAAQSIGSTRAAGVDKSSPGIWVMTDSGGQLYFGNPAPTPAQARIIRLVREHG